MELHIFEPLAVIKMKHFNTILYKVLSPKNVGMIIRSHVAFGGDKIVFVGYDKPWDFKKGSQAFSRKLESECEFLHFKNEIDFFKWSKREGILNYAVEINEEATVLSETKFAPISNLIVGSEKLGLPADFVTQCDSVIVIPQFGQVECLNVSISSSIAMYEFRRNDKMTLGITKSKFETKRKQTANNV